MFRSALVSVLLAVPAAMHGQTTGDELARQRAVVDSLLPAWRAASRELYYGDSLREARRRAQPVALDTAVIGPFTIIARDNEAREHFRNFRQALTDRAPMFEGLPAQPRVQLFVERDIGQDDALRYRAKQSNGRHVRIFGGSPGRRMRFTRAAADDAIYEYVPANVRAWLRGGELSRGNERANVYREMATSSSPVTQACHRGDAGACMRALQLTAVAPDSGALSGAPRASLLLHALVQGGAGSLARMRAARDQAPAVAIEQASRQPLSELIAAWRSDVARSYVSHAGLSRASAAVLFWSVIALLLAVRSTRRRAE